MTAEKSKWSPEPPGGDLSPLILREKPEKPSEYASTDTPREVFTPSPSPGIPSVQLDGTSSKGRSRARAQQSLNPILPAFSLAGTALSKHSATPRVTSQPPPIPIQPHLQTCSHSLGTAGAPGSSWVLEKLLVCPGMATRMLEQSSLQLQLCPSLPGSATSCQEPHSGL